MSDGLPLSLFATTRFLPPNQIMSVYMLTGFPDCFCNFKHQRIMSFVRSIREFYVHSIYASNNAKCPITGSSPLSHALRRARRYDCPFDADQCSNAQSQSSSPASRQRDRASPPFPVMQERLESAKDQEDNVDDDGTED